jgi:cell wall-associated NlpC family hydrolase
VLAAALGMAPKSAYAVTAAEKQAEAEAALQQLNAMQEKLTECSNNYYAALAEYQEACSNRDAAVARIDEINAEISDIQTRLGSRARDMYRGGAASFLDLLLGAATFDEFTKSWDLLNKLNQNDADLVAHEKELKAEAVEQEKEYVRQASLASEKSDEAGKAYADSEQIVAQMQETYNALNAEAQALYEQEAAAAAAAAAAAENYGGNVGYENEDGTVTDASTGQVYSSASEYSAATGNAIVDRARAAIGSAYVWGGVGGSDGGYDCSGLVSYAITGEHSRLGTSYDFMNYTQVSDPQPGDIVVNNGHTGIYIGGGRMIHASTYGVGVIESDVQDDMIYVRY